jgi:hypothetical protein
MNTGGYADNLPTREGGNQEPVNEEKAPLSARKGV